MIGINSRRARVCLAMLGATVAASAFSATPALAGMYVGPGLTGINYGLAAAQGDFIVLGGGPLPVAVFDPNTGMGTVPFHCEASSAMNHVTLSPIQAVQFKADGCQLQRRADSTSAWQTVSSAPGFQPAGAISVTQSAPTVLAGRFRVCWQATAHFLDGSDTTSPRGCSDASGGSELVGANL
jgi:hypothetical protein